MHMGHFIMILWDMSHTFINCSLSLTHTIWSQLDIRIFEIGLRACKMIMIFIKIKIETVFWNLVSDNQQRRSSDEWAVNLRKNKKKRANEFKLCRDWLALFIARGISIMCCQSSFMKKMRMFCHRPKKCVCTCWTQ